MGIYSELHRPQFHFSARENWINDPNGLVHQDGVWHLFFQHNPEATVWGNMTWGHAVSDDLMHWRQLEHALYPDEHGSMFSGSAVIDHENTAGFGKGALLALAGCGAAIATETVAEIDFGSWTAPVAAAWSIGFNLLRKWIPAGH